MACVDGLAVALLAAGRSTRFGTADKLDATLGERPLLEWAARAGLAIEAQWRCIVAGPDLQADVPAYERLTNLHPERGLASSLGMAARAAEEKRAQGLLILLADMPFVQVDHLRGLVDAYRQDRSRPVFSAPPDGVPQPPVLFPAELFGALQTFEGDKGARSLAAGAALIEASADSLLDIDTLKDLERARDFLRG